MMNKRIKAFGLNMSNSKWGGDQGDLFGEAMDFSELKLIL